MLLSLLDGPSKWHVVIALLLPFLWRDRVRRNVLIFVFSTPIRPGSLDRPGGQGRCILGVVRRAPLKLNARFGYGLD